MIIELSALEMIFNRGKETLKVLDMHQLHGFTALENVLAGMNFSPRKPDITEVKHYF